METECMGFPMSIPQPVTYLGLCLSLPGIPIAVNGFQYLYGEMHSALHFPAERLLEFAVAGAVLCIAACREKAPLSSICPHSRAVGWSVLGGFTDVG
jgi:hypothetical protein